MPRRSRLLLNAVLLCLAVAAVLAGSRTMLHLLSADAAGPGATERVSVDSAGNQANSSTYYSDISADGRYVAFRSDASNLVPGDTNGARDVFVHDRVTGATERVTVDSAGAQGNNVAAGEFSSISADPNTYCNIMRADVDGDGAVSILDLAKVAQYFTQSVAPAPERYDYDGDAKISILDLTHMAQVFTQHVSACAAPPAPTPTPSDTPTPTATDTATPSATPTP